MANQVFNPKSPGAIYSVSAIILIILASLGVGFTEPVDQLAGQIQTSISGGSYFSLVALIGGSVLFPVWNLIQKKQKPNWKNLFGSTSNVIALGVAVMGLIALTGFVLPDGTVDQIVLAVYMKDWGALAGMLVSVVIPTIIRFIKSKKAPATA